MDFRMQISSHAQPVPPQVASVRGTYMQACFCESPQDVPPTSASHDSQGYSVHHPSEGLLLWASQAATPSVTEHPSSHPLSSSTLQTRPHTESSATKQASSVSKVLLQRAKFMDTSSGISPPWSCNMSTHSRHDEGAHPSKPASSRQASAKRGSSIGRPSDNVSSQTLDTSQSSSEKHVFRQMPGPRRMPSASRHERQTSPPKQFWLLPQFSSWEDVSSFGSVSLVEVSVEVESVATVSEALSDRLSVGRLSLSNAGSLSSQVFVHRSLQHRYPVGQGHGADSTLYSDRGTHAATAQ